MAMAPHPELSSLADPARSCLLARLTVSDKSGGKCSRCGRRFSGGKAREREREERERERKIQRKEKKNTVGLILRSVFQNAALLLTDLCLVTKIKHFPGTLLGWPGNSFVYFQYIGFWKLEWIFSLWKFSKQNKNLLKVFNYICGHFPFKTQCFVCMSTSTSHYLISMALQCKFGFILNMHTWWQESENKFCDGQKSSTPTMERAHPGCTLFCYMFLLQILLIAANNTKPWQ